jgi:hypothetical protein
VGITDIVAEDHLTPAERAERGSYTGCIAGALSISEFETGMREAGLAGVSITPTHRVADGMVSAIVQATKPIDGVVEVDRIAPPATRQPIELLPVVAGGCGCGEGGCC